MPLDAHSAAAAPSSMKSRKRRRKSKKEKERHSASSAPDSGMAGDCHHQPAKCHRADALDTADDAERPRKQQRTTNWFDTGAFLKECMAKEPSPPPAQFLAPEPSEPASTTIEVEGITLVLRRANRMPPARGSRHVRSRSPGTVLAANRRRQASMLMRAAAVLASSAPQTWLSSARTQAEAVEQRRKYGFVLLAGPLNGALASKIAPWNRSMPVPSDWRVFTVAEDDAANALEVREQAADSKLDEGLDWSCLGGEEEGAEISDEDSSANASFVTLNEDVSNGDDEGPDSSSLQRDENGAKIYKEVIVGEADVQSECAPASDELKRMRAAVRACCTAGQVARIEALFSSMA